MIHLKLQIICEQEFILLGGQVWFWTNRIWNKADPYTATGHNLVRKQAQASNSCFKAISLHALETTTEKGGLGTNNPPTLAFSGPIWTRSAVFTEGPWRDAPALSAPVFRWRLLVDRSGRWLPKVTRQVSTGERVVRTARLQMFSVAQPAPSARGGRVETCSHSGNTHIHIHAPTSNKEAFYLAHRLVKWGMANTQWGMAHLLWLICSSPIVGILYIHIQYLHTSGMRRFVAEGSMLNGEGGGGVIWTSCE